MPTTTKVIRTRLNSSDTTPLVANTFKVEVVQVEITQADPTTGPGGEVVYGAKTEGPPAVVNTAYYSVGKGGGTNVSIGNSYENYAMPDAQWGNNWANTNKDTSSIITVKQYGNTLLVLDTRNLHGFGQTPYATNDDVLRNIAAAFNA